MRTTGFFKLAIALAAPFLLSPCCCSAEIQPVNKVEEAKWLQWVIPLPREIAIQRKVAISAKQITITLNPEASQLERDAAAELAEVFQQKAGINVPISTGKSVGSGIEILLGTCGKDGRLAARAVPGAERLWSRPCRDQAYRIIPLDDRTLALVGTQPQGVYYAAKTLKQLLFPAFGQNGDRAVVTIPLAQVTDWPDIAERGLWGGSANQDIAWLAERKMNLVEAQVDLSLRADGRGLAVIPVGLLAQARRHAVKLVPIINHLEQLPPSIIVQRPELKAVGDENAWRKMNARPLCFSQPGTQQILSDWLECLARYPEVSDVNVWLSENEVPCACPKCKTVNPYVLQTRLVLRAWEAAKRVKPDLRLRILLTQGSYQSNDQVLAAVPPEVGITYYDGGRTYNSSREPMIYPLLVKYVRADRWLGCYPQLTASWGVVCPWSGPQFIKARMSEFAAKHLQCLCGYAWPSNRFYEFNVTAAAEWSWNVGGRSEREFSLAWATRAGLVDPQKGADWAVTLGPVGWDVYGSSVPINWVLSLVGSPVQQGRPPRLGRDIFRYFPTKEHFDQDLAACQRAMRLAQDLHSPALIEETRVICGLVKILKGLYLMAEAVVPGKKMTASERERAAAALALADRASQEVDAGLVAWGIAVAPELMPKGPAASSRFADTIDCLARVLNEAGDVAANLGIDDPRRPYRSQRIGDWTTDDFKTGAAQKKTWEVSKFVAQPGRYRVMFCYDNGWYGTGINRVALVSTTAKDISHQTELAYDAHDGITGHTPKDTTYDLTLRDYDPQRRYFVVADIVGVSPTTPPDRAGCSGHATMKKLK